MTIDRRRMLQGMAAGGAMAGAPALATARSDTPPGPIGRTPPATSLPALELAFAVDAPSSPTGLAIDARGRAFVFMPRLGSDVTFSVGVVAADGSMTPWPNATTNRPDPERPQDTFFHVPNGVFDAVGRLWVLDAGINGASGPPTPGAAKLMCFDGAGKPQRVIPLGSVVEPTSSLNDLRVHAGGDGRESAFVTDQGQDGQGALIAVDLASGRAVRRLGRASMTRSVKGITKIVEGRAVMKRARDGSTSPVQGGANGIALSPDGKRLFWAPLMARHLYSVATDLLLDPNADDAAIGAAVEDLGEKGLTGGLETDATGRVWLALQEHNAVGVREPDGEVRIVAHDPRLIWADTFSIHDGWLYVSSAQVNRRPEFNDGVDRQRKPYAVLRMRLSAS